MKTIALTGGGSAGHVVPNLALLPELKKYFRVVYIGTQGIEHTLLKNSGVTFYDISAVKFVRGSLLKNVKLPVRLFKSVKQAEKVLTDCKADVVFSKGGYVALPVVLAARRKKIPVYSHESDYSPGLANKIIAKRCNAVFTSFPETADKFKNGVYSGSPVRAELFGASRLAALQKYGFDGKKPILLTFGGGSGSAAITQAVEAALDEILQRFDVLHIRGKNGDPPEKRGYVSLEYERDMASAYACADYVLARAGSNTVFELAALKKPALLVPLHNKRSRGDQEENAVYFAERGLCRVLPEKELTPKKLTRALYDLLEDRTLLRKINQSSFRSGNDFLLNELKKYAEP